MVLAHLSHRSNQPTLKVSPNHSNNLMHDLSRYAMESHRMLFIHQFGVCCWCHVDVCLLFALGWSLKYFFNSKQIRLRAIPQSLYQIGPQIIAIL